MSLEITFHGAAGCVTGSCHHLKTAKAELIIDCGLFQGSKTLKALNYQPFPFEARKLDAVLLTHAHIDHSGQLPKLMRAGFRGPIHATGATTDLARIMLADCGHLQESEVEHLNRREAKRGHAPVAPIYTAADAEKVMRQFSKVDLGDWLKVAEGVKARWWNAGHLLGSASIELEVEADEGPVRLLFSGDIGPGGSDFLADPEGPSGVDHLIMESTYGGTVRAPADAASRRRALKAELLAAHALGGPLLMPAFAIERTQELLADLMQLMADDAVPPTEIFLDSPLAIEACEIFLQRGWNGERNPFDRVREKGGLHFLVHPWDSDKLAEVRGWHIIMAGSGMCDAGRIRKHLQRLLWKRETTLLLSGFQAQGTLGRLLQEGRRTVRIQGEAINVRAKVRSLDVYSGHADAEALEAWAKARAPIAGNIFVVHGEPHASAALKDRLGADFPSERIVVPALDGAYRLTPAGAEAEAGAARLTEPLEAGGLDWHNTKSELFNQLEARLDHAENDKARARIIDKLLERLHEVG